MRVVNWLSDQSGVPYLMDDLEKPNVTLLGGAIDPDGSVWVVADAKDTAYDQVSGDAFDASLQEKLYRQGETLAWGYYGPSAVGTPFRSQLGSIELGAWDKFESDCRLLLRSLNAGRSLNGVLFGGFIRDEPKLLSINGNDAVRQSEACLFAGNGRIAAKAAWNAAERLRPTMTIKDRLLVAMGSIIDEEDTLDFPISLWNVRRKGGITTKRVLRDQLPRFATRSGSPSARG
jgi:hypothetical protein